MTEKRCVFCEIISAPAKAHVVFEDDATLAILDHRPLLHGHCLLMPKEHVETVLELNEQLVSIVFRNMQRVTRGVQAAMEADGSFIAINTHISQSVPHVHVHIVPRWQKDGLFSKTYQWLRHPYKDEEQMREVAAKIRAAIKVITQ